MVSSVVVGETISLDVSTCGSDVDALSGDSARAESLRLSGFRFLTEGEVLLEKKPTAAIDVGSLGLERVSFRFNCFGGVGDSLNISSSVAWAERVTRVEDMTKEKVSD